VEVFVDVVTGRPRQGAHQNQVGRNTTMNETVIEAQARYLIEDRIHAARPSHSADDCRRRRRRRLRKLSLYRRSTPSSRWTVKKICASASSSRRHLKLGSSLPQ
jgi:hypothetical protein